MTGTFINAIAVLIGSIVGLTVGNRLPDRIKNALLSILGLCTLGFGIQMFLKTGNPLVVVISLLAGACIGEAIQIDRRLYDGMRSGTEQPTDVVAVQRNPARAFLTAGLLFCVGPMTILGSFQDGLTGDYRLLLLKSVMDGVSAIALSSALGFGVAASALLVLVLQGGLSLAAGQLQPLLSPAMLTEFTATGGIILMGIAVSDLLKIHPVRSANWLPALLLAPLLTYLAEVFGMSWGT